MHKGIWASIPLPRQRIQWIVPLARQTWLEMLATCWQHVAPTAKCWHFWPTSPCHGNTKPISTQYFCVGDCQHCWEDIDYDAKHMTLYSWFNLLKWVHACTLLYSIVSPFARLTLQLATSSFQVLELPQSLLGFHVETLFSPVACLFYLHLGKSYSAQHTPSVY